MNKKTRENIEKCKHWTWYCELQRMMINPNEDCWGCKEFEELKESE